jgi:hypothetical protein
VWEGTVITAFDGFSVALYIFWIARTMFSQIERTIAKETVKIFDVFMTRIIFTCSICKIS